MKILLLNANPYEQSFCRSLADNYYQGAVEAGHEIKYYNLTDLKFDPVLHGGYTEPMELEPDLQKQQEALKWCEHLVIVTPLWWMSTPAILKGYFDRVLLPGFAFKFTGPGKWDKFLEGRSARVIYNQGAPFFFTYLFCGDAFWKALKKGTLEFCGFKPVKRTCFHNVPMVSEEKRQNWLRKVFKMGKDAI